MSDSVNKYPFHPKRKSKNSIVNRLRFAQQSNRIQAYIKEIVSTAETLLGKNSIEAVAIFGSASYDKIAQQSDIDLLMIVNNLKTHSEIQQIEPILQAIEIKHNFAKNYNRWDDRITEVINRMTGMFCSHFICRRNAWDKQIFPDIFNTTHWLTKILAPYRIVMDSMKSGANILAGEIDLKPSYPNFSPIQLFKSLSTCLLLAISSLFILPLNSENIKYCMEAYKWSLRSCSFYLFHEAWPLTHIINLFKKSEIINGFLDEFMQLRRNPHMDVYFALRLPWHIIKLHILTMKYKKKSSFD